MKISNELKTGAVVVAAICVGVLFWIKTTNFSSTKPYTLKTYFNFAEGIKPDTIVKLAGIDVGRVQSIKFIYDPDTRVELALSIDKNAKVREDSLAFIAIAGLVGDTYIGLTSGTSSKGFLKEGDLVASEEPIEMRKIWKKAEGIADNIDKTLVEIRNLAGNLNGVVKDNKSKIDGIVTNLEATSANFKDFSGDIKQHPWKLLMKGKE